MNLQELIKQYQQKQEGGGSGPFKKEDFVQFELGVEKMVRILPFGDEPGDFVKQTAIHAVGDKKYDCPRATDAEETCPICTLYFQVWNDIKAAGGKDNPQTQPMQDFAKSLRAYGRYFFNVYDRHTNEVKIWTAGYTVFDKVIEHAADPDYGAGITSPADVNDGWDMRCMLSKKGQYNSYEKFKFRPKATPLSDSDEQTKEILNARYDLNLLVNLPTEEDLDKAASMKESEYHKMIGAAQVIENPAGSNESTDDEDKFVESLDDMES